jgi:hypothetical protein
VSSEFVKRSIVLTDKLADEMDRLAIAQGRSFASLVRDAVQFWLSQNKSGSVAFTSSSFEMDLTKEEQALVKKISELLGLDNSGVLKLCWTEGLPAVIDMAQRRKEKIEAMTKSL